MRSRAGYLVARMEERSWLIAAVELRVLIGLITLVDAALIGLSAMLLAGNC